LRRRTSFSEGELNAQHIGPFSAYRTAYAHWQQAEEALQSSGVLTIKTAEGHPRVNPLVRIASQAMADMQRMVLRSA
jgi:phage terminase small subunit